MKTVSLSVIQTAEDIDDKGIDAAVQMARGKIQQLGLKDFESASLSFKIGPTYVSFSSETAPDEDEDMDEG